MRMTGKIYFALMICSVFSININAQQGTWLQKTNFGGAVKQQAVGFSIGNFGYLGLGYEAFTANPTDFWQYDPNTNSWTQKASFPGGARWATVGFSVGNFGYISTGFKSGPNTFYSDLWRYDPSSNSWQQKANFPGGGRWYSVGFSIGNKGYVGLGYNSLSATFYSDVWEYDPSQDTWTAKANFPGTKNFATSFSVGTKGYVVGGSPNTGACSQDLWEFDPTTNNWVQKASYPGIPCDRMVSFTIGNYGYAGTGKATGNGMVTQDFYKYDPSTDTWTPIPFFPGIARWLAVGFNIGNSGYIGTGNDNTVSPTGDYNDFWQYTPCVAPTLTLTTSSKTVCIGQTATLTANGSGITTYSWSNGGSTSSAPVTPTINTTYTMTANAATCPASATIAVAIMNCAGVSEFYKLDNSFKIYPNPNGGDFSVSSQAEENILLMDVTGRTIKKIELNQKNGYIEKITGLGPGIYFLQSNSNVVRVVVN
jgi:N-acetylneuraminic acid mutarotase